LIDADIRKGAVIQVFMGGLLMQDAFAGGVAVITGAGSGIGRALPLSASDIGMKVVVAEYVAERGEAVAKEIQDKGGDALFVQTDRCDGPRVGSKFGTPN
jgi:NADP-dependent 3-hydroxy acid dehydrogenase YdfG